jgi:hypothetical protein
VTDLVLQTNLSVFINTLINSCHELEDRVGVHRDFLELSLDTLIDTVRYEMASVSTNEQPSGATRRV